MEKVLQTKNKFTNNIMQSVYSPRAVFKFFGMNKNIIVRLFVKIITENIKYS